MACSKSPSSCHLYSLPIFKLASLLHLSTQDAPGAQYYVVMTSSTTFQEPRLMGRGLHLVNGSDCFHSSEFKLCNSPGRLYNLPGHVNIADRAEPWPLYYRPTLVLPSGFASYCNACSEVVSQAYSSCNKWAHRWTATSCWTVNEHVDWDGCATGPSRHGQYFFLSEH